MAEVLTTAFSTNPLTDAIIERYMYAKVLPIAQKEAVFWKLGKQAMVPSGESRTITFQRFPRITQQMAPLTEGVAPDGTNLTVEKVQAILEQWGNRVTLTDVAMLTVRHEPFQRALELIGLDAAETVDREVQRVLQSGTNVFFPNGRATRDLLQATDYPDTLLLRKVVAEQRQAGMSAYEGRRYVGVCDPYNSQDIQSDQTFVPAAQYSNLAALHEAELGIWMGVRWIESNHMPVLVLNTNCNPTTGLDDVEGTEVTLAAGDYVARLVGRDSSGFETQYSEVGTTRTITADATGKDILTVTTPAFPTGVVAFSLYVSVGGASYLLKQDCAASSVYRVSSSGAASTAALTVTWSTAGDTAEPIPATGVSVHQMYIIGKDYYACTELKGIQILRTPPGPSVGNELDQKRSIGWKAFFKACILDQNGGARIECESDYD